MDLFMETFRVVCQIGLLLLVHIPLAYAGVA